ncbi:LysR substrate-binding domain-containing protein [Roseobacter sinensis]|uniref:LysR substrate-binding domain-containing protein n=1 Tax=Roseobacter sinensis TaxID=2931391 RepID=A0ABT3BLB3_9RHOB|nr:LysR substrate-binding domain-containing protein [Roseobacter sp. WL0113]MCV3274369.1 LysR substrate-binding domain-containing protein [Roseobacter sp. WL0113]
MISARQLEVLSTVIEVGTTARAAELLAVSQPAISNMIRHTEDLIGFPLFHREHGRLTPTHEARHIAQEAQHLFMQQKRVESIVNELRGGTIGRLSIVATPSIGHGILPHVLSRFMEQRPKLQLSIELGSIDEINRRLVSGRADLGLSITPPRHSALSVHEVGAGRMMCVCPDGHELGLLDTISIADLNHVQHISYGTGTPLGQQIDKVFSERGLERRYFCEVRHTATALEMVRNGLGVALVDSFALIGQRHHGVTVRDTSPELPLNMHAVTSNLFPTSNLALRFQSFLADVLIGGPVQPGDTV